jgi:hypothetical protein
MLVFLDADQEGPGLTVVRPGFLGLLGPRESMAEAAKDQAGQQDCQPRSASASHGITFLLS